METVSLIREKLWDRAQWSGTVYYFTPEAAQPPIFGLLFKDGAAAGEIFSEWRKELGQRDKNERLRLSIVRGINRKNPFSYRVVIGTKPEMRIRSGRGQVLMISRLNTMNASTDINLNGFLASYKKFGFFALAHAVLTDPSATPELVMKNCIAKRELHVRQAWEIGPNDLDSMGVADDDQRIIPPEKPDAPVLDLFKWKRSLR